MKKSEIKSGTTYSTKTGNAARKVLKIGPQVGEGSLPRPRWLGEDATAPGPDEMLVEYEQIRGTRIGSREIVFISQFATWAAKEDVGAGGNVVELRAEIERLGSIIKKAQRLLSVVEPAAIDLDDYDAVMDA